MFTNIVAAAALVATVSAGSNFASDPNQYNGNSSCDASLTTTVKVVNRCPYDVYLWSVLKGMGCPSSDAVVLKTGDYYRENYRPAYEGSGVSLKLSKENSCGSDSIAQLEYYIDNSDQYGANYLDMSYVNCQSKECPTADLGYYLISGNQEGYSDIAGATANTGGPICPILSCDGWESCSGCSYILPDDTQTKSCNKDAPLTLYMCGSEAPGDESSYPSSSAAASSSSQVKSSSSAAQSSSSSPPPTSAAYVQKAEITQAPAESSSKPVNVKTEVVYVTEYAYVNAKRHAHAHAHGQRHQHFRA
jgi:hypothetical protein